jgi:pimeloyl-ACP methyl ester carboxylesterase
MNLGAVEIDGRRWSFVEAGAGALLLLFHGTLSGKETYADLLGPLAERRRVVAFDWPGHGGTEFDPAGWTVPDLVDSVPRLIDALGGRTATIGGVSQGGAVSLRVAIAYPDRIDGLITISAGPDRPGQAAVGMLKELGATLAEGSDAERRAALAAVQGSFHAPGWVDANPEAARRELDLMLAHPRAAMPGVTKIPTTYDSVEERLSEIACPTLVVWGEHDARAFWGEPMAELIPESRLRLIAGAGHHVPLDAPEELTETIVEFLEDLDE